MKMKGIVLIFLLVIKGTWAACLSESLEKPLGINFDLRGAEHAVQEFETLIRRDLPTEASLVISLEVLNPRVNAEVQKREGEIFIQIMGGMLTHPQMGPETLKLLLCHEIGHVLGGTPLKSRTGWSSTEGQADFHSSSCARQIGFDEGTFFDSALALATIYAEVTREPIPRLDSCDQKIVERTNYGYPSVQCRLDTLVSGWRGQKRPKCWFRE
jgi:hypothetical protein